MFEFEYTDTFGGQANYCWVNRGTVAAETMREALRMARSEIGMTGHRGDITGSFGDETWWKPRNCATVLMVRWHDCPSGFNGHPCEFCDA